MSATIVKFIKSAIPNSRSHFRRCFSASRFKLSENDVEEIEIPVPWGHIAGKWWGDKNTPPVLAIHGWQDNANSFDRLIPLLNVPSVLAIDLPGHGLSSHLLDGRAYDFGEHIIMLHRIKKYFNWGQMPLLTHSLGAALGYAYASMFPDHVKWVINLECARATLTLLRNDVHAEMSKGIDTLLKMEKQKKQGSPPAYKLSKMIEMTIEGSLGSIASPEAAFTILKRGMHVTDTPTEKTDDKMSGDLATLVKYEQHAMISLSQEERENVLKLLSGLTEIVRQAKEDIKTSPVVAADDKYFVFKRDPSVKVLFFQSLDEEFVTEAAKNIKCPVLSMRARQGFLFGTALKLYKNTLNILKENCKYFEHHDVDGTHHAHLNNPETLAPIINNFILTCETLKRKWWGSKNVRPVLCLHGWQDNANSFDTLIPQLSPELSYLAIDLPGHGLSSYNPKGFFYKAYDTASLIRRIQFYFDWPKVSLIGHSYGAMCSFLFCSLFSNSADFFIAIDAIKSPSRNTAKDIEFAARKIEKLLFYEALNISTAPTYNRDELVKAWVKGSNNTLTENSCNFLIQRGTKENNGMFKITRDPRVKKSFGIHFTHKQNLKFAEAIACNVLFLKALDASYFEKKELVLEVLNVIKQKAKYYEEHFLTGNHFVHLNNPEIVAPVINSFLQTVRGQQ